MAIFHNLPVFYYFVHGFNTDFDGDEAHVPVEEDGDELVEEEGNELVEEEEVDYIFPVADDVNTVRAVPCVYILRAYYKQRLYLFPNTNAVLLCVCLSHVAKTLNSLCDCQWMYK
jgi:hypothetical protein